MNNYEIQNKKLESLKRKEQILQEIEVLKAGLPLIIQQSIEKELVNLGIIKLEDSNIVYAPNINDIMRTNAQRYSSGDEKTKAECFEIGKIYNKINKKIVELKEVTSNLNIDDTIDNINQEIEKERARITKENEEKEKELALRQAEKEIVASMKDLPADLRLYFADKLESNGLYSDITDKFLSSDMNNVYELGTPGNTSIKDYRNRSEQITKEIANTEEELAQYQKEYNESVVEKINSLPNSDLSKYSDLQKYEDIIKKNISRLNSLKVEQQNINRVIRNYNITNRLINKLLNTPEQEEINNDILSIDNIEEKQLPSVIEEKELSEIPSMEVATKSSFENLLGKIKESKERIPNKSNSNRLNVEPTNMDYESLSRRSEELRKKIEEAERGKMVEEAVKVVNPNAGSDAKIAKLEEEIANYKNELAKILPLLNLYKQKQTSNIKQEETKKSADEKVLLLEDKKLKEEQKNEGFERKPHKKYGRKEVKGVRKSISNIKKKIKKHLNKIALGLLLITLGITGTALYNNKNRAQKESNYTTETETPNKLIPEIEDITKENNENIQETESENILEDWSKYVDDEVSKTEEAPKELEEQDHDMGTTEENNNIVAESQNNYYNEGEHVTIGKPEIYNSIDSFKNKNAKHPLFFEEEDLSKVNAYVKKIIWQDETGTMKVENVKPEDARDRMIEIQENGNEVIMALVYTKAAVDDYKEEPYGWVEASNLNFYSTNRKGHSR